MHFQNETLGVKMVHHVGTSCVRWCLVWALLHKELYNHVVVGD